MLCFIFQITKGMKQFNKKSLDIEKNNEIYHKLFAFYNKYIFRKLNGYMN
jgi:flagellin-specific chaperone FliS